MKWYHVAFLLLLFALLTLDVHAEPVEQTGHLADFPKVLQLVTYERLAEEYGVTVPEFKVKAKEQNFGIPVLPVIGGLYRGENRWTKEDGTPYVDGKRALYRLTPGRNIKVYGIAVYNGIVYYYYQQYSYKELRRWDERKGLPKPGGWISENWFEYTHK